MLHYADTNGLLDGTTKKSIPMESVKNISFTRKTFLDVARENPQLLPALYELILPNMRKMLSVGNDFNSEETEEQRLDAYSKIMSMI